MPKSLKIAKYCSYPETL